LTISYDAFMSIGKQVRDTVFVNGYVLVVNTRKTFANLERRKILNDLAAKVSAFCEKNRKLHKALRLFIAAVDSGDVNTCVFALSFS
uniref:Myosin motor domain-containing protein n=1 Tax=Gongylonema pulchrum TaxID=637853 RepID=A0A183DI94_9BILA